MPEIYKLRRTKMTAAGNYYQHALTVPQSVGEKMAGRQFVCQITDEGLLYTPVEAQDELPDWTDGTGA